MTRGPCRTLMRPTCVKRQTPSRSGFLTGFFRLFPLARSASGLVGSLAFLLQVPRKDAAPHPYGGSTAIAMAMAERCCPVAATEKPLGALIPSYSTGRLHVCRAPVSVRLGGGAAHVTLMRPSPPVSEPERVSNQPQRAQGSWPRCSWAFTDAARPALQSTRLRLTPCPSSEASGSPAPLTSQGETWAPRRPGGV
jgi:hypothetical protein